MSIIYKWHKSWNDFMTTDVLNELNNIETKIGTDYFPESGKVLRFMQNDLTKVKYIIVGMEPYPSSYVINGTIIPEATGRSFEISSVSNWAQKFKQSSLRNILKTIYYNEYNEKILLDDIRKKINSNEYLIAQPHDWFNNLEKQGVLFLNATLTVQPGKVDTHTKYWNNFMNKLITYIVSVNPDVKWLLWGDKAQKRILPLIDDNTAICTVHPRLDEFINQNCFSQIKDINWLGNA